jgi:hypothetical protein
LSARSLLIEMAVNSNALGTATAFVVESSGKHFLITNWHVVAGRDPDTNQLLSSTGAVPDEIRIVHHGKQKLGSWVIRSQKLYDQNRTPLWIEHPLGNKIDLVAVPLTRLDPAVEVYPFDLKLADFDIVAEVAMPVSIIGFPYGLSSAGAWPIWKTGHIATDPDLDYGNCPVFLIDATTRGGMSGSPVVLRLFGGYNDRAGNYIMAGGMSTRFLGVYAGRIHDQAEIGRVWRPHLINEILASAGASGP